MSCDELREWLSAELDGEARGAKRTAVRVHRAACPACREAQAAAETLRQGLAKAASGPPHDERDEALLAVLRLEGLCGELTAVEPESHERYQQWRGEWREWFSSLCLCGLIRIRGATSLGPALAAMALSFLLTWSSLCWAEIGRPIAPDDPSSRSATARVVPPEAEVLDEWMAGEPSLAALSRLQWRPTRPHVAPVQLRRGALVQQPRRMG